MKGKISISGYRSDSKDKNNDFNLIPSSNISMKGVKHNVFGVDDMGNMIMMEPGGEYKFPGKSVLEIPIKGMKGGGEFSDKIAKLVGEGYPQKQAVAIAYSMQRAGKFQQGGSFVVPQNATKVTDVPSDFQFSGEQGNRKYFVKNVAAPGAVTGSSGNTNFDAERHKQFLIQQLQAGVKPEDLVSSGHATTSGIQPLRGYFKPAAVYIEPSKTVLPQRQGIPLNESDRLDMKQIFPPSGGKYLTFSMPDPNANYSKSTELYYDPTTYRQIDPGKSFDNSGNYSPSFIYSDPNQGTLSDKYRGTKVATRQDVSKIGTTDSLNVNPVRMGTVGAGFQMGGTTINKDFFSNFLSSYFESDKNSSQAPQGQNTDKFIQNKQGDFLKYLKKNVVKHFVTNELSAFSDAMNYGGTKKAQQGMQVDLYDPNDPTKKPPTNNMLDYYTGPFGPYGSQPVPTEVSSVQGSYPKINVESNSGTSSNLNLTPGADANTLAYQNYVKNLYNQNQKTQKTDNVASGVVAGMNVFSNIMEQANNRKYQKTLKDQMSAENIFSDLPQNQGDYDMNSGAFRPNKMVPAFYRSGGEYLMDDKEIKRLKSLGYEIDVIQ